jgi:hypothetical protein
LGNRFWHQSVKLSSRNFHLCSTLFSEIVISEYMLVAALCKCDIMVEFLVETFARDGNVCFSIEIVVSFLLVQLWLRIHHSWLFKSPHIVYF